ncbi:MAG: tubulin-like doman-containing protein [Candidatus Methylumidiphilus sp.]
MADNDIPNAAPASRPEQNIKLRPTLYIGVGGTGMEVILRIRRRILNAVWGPPGRPARLDSLTNFPVAQFIHFDLDQGALVETGKSQVSDPLADRVKLADDDKLVEAFEIERYSKSDDDLARYPHIESWSPLTPKKIREIGIDPAKGAGQIRAISRLYFFDKYPKTKEKIRAKLVWLQSGLTKDAQFKALDLDLDHSKFRIVVIGSVAGGTGAGSFLDMGWLAKWIAKETVSAADVEMMMFLPTGYQGANKERTEANGYASFMELETCMRGGSNYVSRWDAYDKPELSFTPYDEVYLIDSGNLAGHHLAPSDQKQVYDMVADTLFEDFASVDFATRKRSVAVNQRQHKILPFSPPVPGRRFGDMKLSYYQGYSSFGQAILDTQRNLRRDLRAYSWSAGMLKAFFGVAAENVGANRATDKQRDEFMATHMQLSPLPFTDFPDFSSREVKINRNEFTDYRLTEALLVDGQGALIDGIQQKVAARVETIATGFERNEWSIHIREALRDLEHDVVRDENAVADVAEDRIGHRAKELYEEVIAKLREQMYFYLDNKEFGGLEFVLSLIEQIKSRLENKQTGLIGALASNAQRYLEVRDALRTHEYERLLGNLEQTKGFSLFSSKEEQAKIILQQLKVEIGNYLKFHVRHTAAERASLLLARLSGWLGEQIGLDERGNARWSGLVGELQRGRSDVLAMVDLVEQKIVLLQQDTRKDHATYILVETPDDTTPLPPPKELRNWADDVFKDIGGSRKLFPLLADGKKREELIGQLRLKAEQQMALPNQALEQIDPLVAALDAMGPGKRQKRFAELLSRAMPWVDANLNKDFIPKPDQFKCYIGVAEPADYERFKEELLAQIPTYAGITPQQVAFVKTGMPGRMVCYCELSGIPLTILKGMESWRTSYRKESEKIPLHTHRDSTQFTHPLAPSTNDLNLLADDFRQYLIGVMLGVLVRDNQARVPPGQYLFTISRGHTLCMGNERSFRLNGLPTLYRDQILEAISEQTEALDATQLSGLAALAQHYAQEVYTPRLVADESGTQIPIKGFSAAIAEEAAQELRNKATRKGMAATEVKTKEKLALECLDEWTRPVENSDADAYAWEIQGGEQARLKRIARPEFFEFAWLEQKLAQAAPVSVAAPTPAHVPPPLAAPAPPPPLPPLLQHNYHLAFNGQTQGPYPQATLQQWIAARQIDPATLAWREGLANWLPLNQIPELAALFAAAVPPPPPPFPGMPPVPPPGAGAN